MAGGGDGLDFGGGGGGDLGGGGGIPPDVSGGDMGMGPSDLGNISGMGFGGPGGFDPTSGYPSGDQSGGGGMPPETATNVTAPQAQAPAPGTTTTSIGGTQTGTPGPTGGQQPAAPPAQQPQQTPQASQLTQLIQQLTKAISPNQANAAPAGPSNLSPSLAQLSQQAQQPTVPGGNGADSTVIVPNAGQGDILSGSQHAGGFGLAPEVEEQPRPPGTPQEGLGIPETGPGGGLGDLARQAPNTGLPATSTDRALDPSQEQPRPPGTPQEAGSQAPTEEQPRPPGTPQEAGSQFPAGDQPRPPGTPQEAGSQHPQAAQATPQTPATPQQAQQGFPGGAMNPMKFIGDILQLLGGNPMPLLSDLASQFGTGPQGGPLAGQPPQPQFRGAPSGQSAMGLPAAQPPQQQQQQQQQQTEEQQPQTEEQKQQQQRQQDLGQPGTYVIGDKGERIRVQTDAKGNPMYDKAGKPIPAPEPAQQGQQPTGTPAPAKTRFNLMRGQYGQPGQNIGTFNSSAGSFKANNAAGQHFVGFINDLKAAGAPGVKNIGGFNIRNIAGTNKISQHSYGNAIDVDQSSYPVHGNKGQNPPLQQWIQSHPQQYAQIAQKWGISNGGDFGDWGHFEWNGGGIQTAAYPPQQLPAGQNRPPADVQQRGDIPAHFASVRHNNPGAMNMGPSAQKFGATGSQVISGNNRIASFPSPVNGAAANFDNLANRGYVGMTIGQAMHRWSGGGRFDPGPNSGFNRNTVITKAMTQDPNFMIPFMKGVSTGEAPGNYPMSDAQWQQAFRWYQNGSVPQGEQALQRGQAGPRQAQTPQQPRIRGLDLLPGGQRAQGDGGPPIQLAQAEPPNIGPPNYAPQTDWQNRAKAYPIPSAPTPGGTDFFTQQPNPLPRDWFGGGSEDTDEGGVFRYPDTNPNDEGRDTAKT
jgi:hypothetical protein